METAELYHFEPLKGGETVTIEERTLLQHIKRVVRAYRQAGLDPGSSDGLAYPGFLTDECEFQIYLGRSRKGAIRGSHFILKSSDRDRERVNFLNEGDIFVFNGICDVSVGRIMRPSTNFPETWVAADYSLNTERLGMINEFMDDHLAQGHFRSVTPDSRLLIPLKNYYH